MPAEKSNDIRLIFKPMTDQFRKHQARQRGKADTRLDADLGWPASVAVLGAAVAIEPTRAVILAAGRQLAPDRIERPPKLAEEVVGRIDDRPVRMCAPCREDPIVERGRFFCGLVANRIRMVVTLQGCRSAQVDHGRVARQLRVVGGADL